jgi:DNA-binding winged helix-turn-helix (wHTH) protein
MSAAAADEDAKFCPHCHTRLDRKAEPKLPAEHFDQGQRAIVVNGLVRKLPPKVWQLLVIFWQRQDRTLSREILMTLLYDGEEAEPEPKILDVYISHLRAALKGAPYMIETTFGEGYLFSAKRPAKVKLPIEIGAAEDGVPLPRPRPKNRAPGILDHLKPLKPGQSVVVRNSGLNSVKTAIAKARASGLGSFVTATTQDGFVRVWRAP